MWIYCLANSNNKEYPNGITAPPTQFNVIKTFL